MNNTLFIITNQGLHPVVYKLKRQFGDDINCITISSGNTPLSIDYAKQLAKNTREYITRNEDKKKIYIVWTGMPVYNAVVYNVIRALNKAPIFLVYNKETEQYEEFNIDARNLIFN